MIGVCYKNQAADQNELGNLFGAITKASKNQAMIMGEF
jgi:hypothetical protein